MSPPSVTCTYTAFQKEENENYASGDNHDLSRNIFSTITDDDTGALS